MADDDEVIACSATLLLCAPAYLFRFNRKQHTVSLKCYLQKRPHYPSVQHVAIWLSHKRRSAMDAVPSNGHCDL